MFLVYEKKGRKKEGTRVTGFRKRKKEKKRKGRKPNQKKETEKKNRTMEKKARAPVKMGVAVVEYDIGAQVRESYSSWLLCRESADLGSSTSLLVSK